MFPLWKRFSSVLGSRSEMVFTWLPPALLALFLAACCWLWLRSDTRGDPVGLAPLAAGIAVCCAGLLVPDPDFPVKRIHVAQYAALSLVARFAMSAVLKGMPLLFYSVCFTAVLGIHDEFLQGLHPARTYGLPDMTVNALGSLGGGLVWHGLGLFAPAGDSGGPASGRTDRLFLCWLLAAVLMCVVPASFFKGRPLQWWTVLPLLGMLAYFLLYRSRFTAAASHGIDALAAAAGALAVYPLLAGLPGMVFF